MSRGIPVMGKADELWRLCPTHKVSHILHNLSVSSLMRVTRHKSPGLGPPCPLNALDNYPLQSDGVEGTGYLGQCPPHPSLSGCQCAERNQERVEGEGQVERKRRRREKRLGFGCQTLLPISPTASPVHTPPKDGFQPMENF